MIDDIAAQHGGRVIRTPVGEANVVQAMLRENAVIGGEGNGGVIDPRIVPGRDSLVGMAYVLQLMAATGKTISQLVAEMPRYEIVKTKFECRREDAEPRGRGAEEGVRRREGRHAGRHPHRLGRERAGSTPARATPSRSCGSSPRPRTARGGGADRAGAGGGGPGAGCRVAGLPDYCCSNPGHADQSSRTRPGTFRKSVMLRVRKLHRARAMAAILRSIVPRRMLECLSR